MGVGHSIDQRKGRVQFVYLGVPLRVGLCRAPLSLRCCAQPVGSLPIPHARFGKANATISIPYDDVIELIYFWASLAKRTGRDSCTA